MFGHPVLLNFNQKGPVHQTTAGGVVSILIRIFMMLYLLDRIIILVKYQGDTLNEVQMPIDLNELGDVAYEDTKVKMYMSI